MATNSAVSHQHNTSAAAPANQVTRMRAAINKAVAIGPDFLHGKVNADHMANTMVHAVQEYTKEEQAAGSDGIPRGQEAQQLQQVLVELMTCGSGYLAGRCDAACVGRTMTEMVHEFGAH